MIDRITEQPFCQTRVSGSTFVNADCFDVFPFIEDKSIDAIICDLPYGTTACKWDTIIPFEPLWAQYKRIIKDNGAIVLFGSQPFTSALVMSNPKWFKYEWIWNKNKGSNIMLAKKQPLKVHENILVFGGSNYFPQMESVVGKIRDQRLEKEKINRTDGAVTPKGAIKYAKDYDPSKKYPTSIRLFTNHREKEQVFHPTQKSLPLLEYLIKTYTNEGDTVLDNTMGSGTTILAAIKNNRIGIGIEKEKQYYDVAVRRASEYLIIDSYKNIQTKENYDKLLSSGMFWEFHPELSGNWDADRSVVQYCH